MAPDEKSLKKPAKNAPKDFEIVALPRLERMNEKEWNDRPNQIAASAHSVGRAVVVVAPDDSTAERRPQCDQQLNVAFVLHDGEFWQHLPARPHAGMRCNADMETTFAVHESCDPFRLER